MHPPLSISTETARPFLPAKDFATSTAFYDALGFTKELHADDVAIYRVGTTSFLLQNHYQEDWAANFMMQLLVDDLAAWWQHLITLRLPETFGVPAPTPPTMQPWGLEISYVVDPSGVLWHVAQRRPDVVHDR